MEVTRKDCQAAQVACGHMHSAYVSKQGEVWCWGMGLHGELGQGDRYDHWLPTLVLELRGLFVTYIACGHGFTLACTGGWILFLGVKGAHVVAAAPVPDRSESVSRRSRPV